MTRLAGPALQRRHHLLIGPGGGLQGGRVGVGGDRDDRAHLAVDLHRHLDPVLDQQRRVDLRELLPGQRLLVAQPGPQLLGGVRGQRRQHQRQRLGHRPRRAAVRVGLGDGVVQLGDPGDRGVEPQRLVALAHRGDGPVQQPVQLQRHLDVGHVRLAGLLVQHHPPDPLQQPVRPDDRLGVPRPGLVQRAGEHLEQPERVGAVGGHELVRGDHVLQALADLAELPVDRLAADGRSRRRARSTSAAST